MHDDDENIDVHGLMMVQAMKYLPECPVQLATVIVIIELRRQEDLSWCPLSILRKVLVVFIDAAS